MAGPGGGATGLRRRLRAGVQETIAFAFPPKPDAELAGPLDRYLDDMGVSWIRAIWAAVGLVSLVLWPTDLIVFKDAPEIRWALAPWRGITLATCVAMYALWSRLRAYRHHRLRFALALVACAALGGLSGDTTGRLGGLDHSYYYGVYNLTVATVWLFYDLPRRAALAGVLSGSYLAGYFLPHMDHARHPELAASLVVLLSLTIGLLLSGHLLYAFVRQSWLLGARMDRQAQALSRLEALADRLLVMAVPLPVARGSEASGAPDREVIALRWALEPDPDRAAPRALLEETARLRAWLQTQVDGVRLRLDESLDTPHVVIAQGAGHHSALRLLDLARDLTLRAAQGEAHAPFRLSVTLDVGELSPAGAASGSADSTRLFSQPPRPDLARPGEIEVTLAAFERLPQHLSVRGPSPTDGPGKGDSRLRWLHARELAREGWAAEAPAEEPRRGGA